MTGMFHAWLRALSRSSGRIDTVISRMLLVEGLMVESAENGLLINNHVFGRGGRYNVVKDYL